ncbi:MAG: CPBP family intramembrane glutamic endopeptidase [Gammaproteobacteria bacterium]
MKQFVQALSGRAEFLIVVLGSLGLSLLSNLQLVLDPGLADKLPPFNNEALLSNLTYEIFVLAWLGVFMKLRGWTFERLGFSISFRDTSIGVLLAIIVFCAVWLIEQVLGSAAPSMLADARRFDVISGELDVWTMVLSSVVDSVFEELFVCAYVIAALKEKRGAVLALNVSVALRVACHLYQGLYGVLIGGALGLVFGYWYLRSGRIWPLFIAHALLQFIELVMLSP